MACWTWARPIHLGGTTLTQRDLMAYATVSFSITGSNRDDTIYGGQRE